MALFNELKRRKVFRVTSFYAVTAWGATLGAAELFPAFGLPDESVRWFVIGALVLLPVVALLAWLYELTPGGIIRDPADRDDPDTPAALQLTNGSALRNALQLTDESPLRIDSGFTDDSATQVAPQMTDDSATQFAPQHTSGELIATWRGNRWSFKSNFTIGRGESCELQIEDPKISRQHARILAQQGAWFVEDLGSSNGTSVNGELVTRAELPGTARITLYDGAEEIELIINSPAGIASTDTGLSDKK